MVVHAKARRTDAAADPEPPEARRTGLRAFLRERNHGRGPRLTEYCGIELDRKYVDVIVQGRQMLSSKKATLDCDGRTFEEISAERRKAADLPLKTRL